MHQQLARFLYPYGSTRRILRGPARGMKVVVEPGLGLSYLVGREASTPRFFARVISPGMTVFDVGANKGQMALLFAALVGTEGQVVALEPAPSEFASLQRNVLLNRLAHVRTLQLAAAESAGELAFAFSPDEPTQGKLVDVEPSYMVSGATTVCVHATSLDSLVDASCVPDMIKVDVEGAAASVLRGARRTIAECRAKFYLELHGPEEQAGVRDELLAHGYVAETLDGTVVADPTAGWFSPLWCYKPDDAQASSERGRKKDAYA